MRVRREEFLLLKAICVANGDQHEGQPQREEDGKRLGELRTSLLRSLDDCSASLRVDEGEDALSAHALLLILPSLRQADPLMRAYWRTAKESLGVRLNKLLEEMLGPSS